MKVVIIGSGNTATVLGGKILAAGHPVVQVISRQAAHAERLGTELHCGYATDLAAIDREADLYLAAVSDSALYTLGEQLSLPGRLIVHTAGAVPKAVLLSVSEHSGVLYPLQSIRKEIRPFPEIPLLIDANQPGDLPVIADFAGTISRQVQTADDATRLRLHVGAVIVNNFGNFLYTLTEEYCRKEGIDFSLLIPIIQETAARLAHSDPRNTQTGPAIRREGTTIEKHLQILNNHKDIKELYSLFTKQIEEFYHPSKMLPS